MQKISESKVITKIIIDVLRNNIDSYNKNIKKMMEDRDADEYREEVIADSAKIDELKEVINQIQKIEMEININSKEDK